MCKSGKPRLKSNLDWLPLTALILAFSSAAGPILAAHPSAQRPILTVTVKNPRCPACLKTLKGYLLEMPEVRAVRLVNFAQTGPLVKLPIELNEAANKTAAAGKVIDRIKAHDLAVLSTKCR
jgi:hypothetical protein